VSGIVTHSQRNLGVFLVAIVALPVVLLAV
jgi:hypothetical protein